MNIFKCSCLIAGAILLLCGCGDSKQSKTSVGHSGLSTFPDSEVLVKVGESALTQGDVAVSISMAQKLASHKATKPLRDKQMATIAERVKKSIFKQFVEQELIHRALQPEKLDVPRDVSLMRQNQFYAKFSNKGEKPEKVASILTADERAVVEKTVCMQAELETYFAEKCTNRLVVTEEEVTAALKRTLDWNKMIDATNAWAYATASNVLKQAMSGADFGELADQYSQDPGKQPGGLIDEPAAVYFSNGRTSYLDMLEQMPEGRITDILECTEGLMIVKVLGISKKTKMHNYQRIIFQTGVKYPEYTRKQIREMGLAECQQTIYAELLASARKSCEVVYPHGEAFFNPKKQGRSGGVDLQPAEAAKKGGK